MLLVLVLLVLVLLVLVLLVLVLLVLVLGDGWGWLVDRVSKGFERACHHCAQYRSFELHAVHPPA